MKSRGWKYPSRQVQLRLKRPSKSHKARWELLLTELIDNEGTDGFLAVDKEEHPEDQMVTELDGRDAEAFLEEYLRRLGIEGD
jgi:hypothetical protein